MNDKNIEEKAKEYSKSQFRDIYANFSRTDISEGYKKGYTQAVTDQQNTLTQYKEALKLLITDCQILLNKSNRLDKNLYSLNKAKQLLNNE